MWTTIVERRKLHYSDVIMGAIASQITSLTIVYSTVYSGADQRKHQSSASLAFLPVTGEFPAQMVSYAENISIWWRHHEWTNASATCRLQAQVLNEWLYEHLLSNPLYIIFKTAINTCWVKSNCNVLTNSLLTFHSTTSQFTKERKHDCFAIQAPCAANPPMVYAL